MPGLPRDVMVIGFGTVVALLLIYAIVPAARRSDARLLIMLLCGEAPSSIEGFTCYLIQCHHVVNGSYAVCQTFGAHKPLRLAEVYVLFFGSASSCLL